MRYNTDGDWYRKRGVDEIRVISGNPDYEFLIAIHEFMEWYLCKRDGISQKEVDMWDKNNDKQGDDKSAPYHLQHNLSTKLEKYAAKLIDVNWNEYND